MKLPIQVVKDDVSQQRGDDAMNAKGNFDFYHVIKHNRGIKKC